MHTPSISLKPWWTGERACSMQPSDYPLISLPKMGWNSNKPQLFPRVICFLGVAYWLKCLGNWLPLHDITMYLLQCIILVVSTEAGRQIVYNLLSCTHVAADHGVCLHCVYHSVRRYMSEGSPASITVPFLCSNLMWDRDLLNYVHWLVMTTMSL